MSDIRSRRNGLPARSAKHFAIALSSRRVRPRQGFRIPFPEMEGNSEVTPLKYKAGKMKRVAPVYFEMRARSEKFYKIFSSELLGTSHFALRTSRFEVCALNSVRGATYFGRNAGNGPRWICRSYRVATSQIDRGCVKTRCYFSFRGPLTLPYPKIIEYSAF